MRAYILKYTYLCIYTHLLPCITMHVHGVPGVISCTAALFISALNGLPPAGLNWGRFGILVTMCAQGSFLKLAGISRSLIFHSSQSENSCPQKELPAGLLAGWLLT